jgi:cytidylate kinase
VAYLVAQALGFHYLDSGALYRLVALASEQAPVPLDDEPAVVHVARQMRIRFEGEDAYLEDQLVTDDIRSERCAAGASKVAAMPRLREALLDRQRGLRQAPGLVAEGRDMGTVVFPDAVLKVFLTASPEERAERRHKQLKQKGIAATLPDLLKDLRERDARDANRSVAPLKPSPEAQLLDTTGLSAAEAAERVLAWYRDPKQHR